MSETFLVPIIVAVITGLFALLGTYLSNSKTSALIVYRLEQLEDKVNKHNQVIERTFLLEEKMKVANHRIDDLERGVKHAEQ